MANEPRGLGKALLGAELRVTPSRGGGTLPIALMQPGAFQPRQGVDREALEELAASIKANGVIQPIVVRPLRTSVPGAPRYEIVAGERRWQAAKLAGLSDIPTMVRELSDGQAVAVALIENIQREELTPAEEARALRRLVEEFALTHQEVADSVGRSRAAVSNLIRLLDLPAGVVTLIDAKRLTMGHARALLGLQDDVERVRLGTLVAKRGLSVRVTESLVRTALKKGSAAAPRVPELTAVSEVLRTKAVHVQLHQRASGKGKLTVEFEDAGSRDAIVAAIKRAVENQDRDR
jgi:ParB family transcriptional regulator, chromosome partitioning protein